jgi:predicted aminopeptidase
MDDLRERVERDETPLQKLAQRIPGFSGYREREIRRNADQQLRLSLVRLLDEKRALLDARQRQAAMDTDLKVAHALDRLTKRLERVRDGIRFADYGYTGWFDAVKIKEAELDRLYDYDASLRNFIEDLGGALRDLAHAPAEHVQQKLDAAQQALDELQTMVEQRADIIVSTLP